MRKVLYILGQFDDLDIEWLARVGLKRTVTPGTVLVHQGRAHDMMLIVLNGELTVTVEGVGQVATLGVGEMVGEIGFVDSAPPSATVTAVSAATVLEIPKAAIEEKANDDHGFGFRFYRAIALFLADRLRISQQQRRNMSQAASLADDNMQFDELDEKLLDTLSLAGDRFDRLLRILAAG